MKQLHFPTLIMHILLIIFAASALNDYPDLFLCISIPVLLFHLIWAFRSKQDFHTAHCIGMILHILAAALGIVKGDSGAFGLDGGGFALFFFNIALGISFAAISLIRIVRYIKQK